MPITRMGSHIYRSEEHPTGVEGEIVKNASVLNRQLYAPPTKDDEIAALRSEVEHLRQILYHKATYAEEREMARFKAATRGISTSSVAQVVNKVATTGFGASGVFTNDRIQLSPQFVFRLLYSVMERTFGKSEMRWEEKPSGLSKLKWLWQNNLLFFMPFAINAFEALVQEMMNVDRVGTKALLNRLDKQLSKQASNKSKP